MRGDRVTTRLIRSLFRKFRKNRDGSATVEFIIALPILLAVMALCVQYGNALKVRNSIDVVARDAARYIARAPLAPDGSIPQNFADKAREIITTRLEVGDRTVRNINFSGTTQTEARVAFDVDVPFGLAVLFNAFRGPNFRESDPSFTLKADDVWRRS
jgi:Flp pilus assembly protein TadG